MEYKEFKDRLRELRTQRGLSQRDLGEKLGVSHATINMYENGKRNPEVETLEAICDYFNVSMDYMRGKEDLSVRLLTSEEMQIIDAYRQAPENIRSAIRQLLEV